MQGLVLSDSFLMLFVFWELTSITSFLLIGFDHEQAASRRAALQALVVTGLGGLSLLAGLLIVWNITGVARALRCSARGDAAAGKPALCCGAAPGARRRLHQVGAVPVPFLAAQRHGGADAGVGLPAFGHHGEGRRLSADAAQPVDGRDRCCGRRSCRCSAASPCLSAALLALRQTDLKLMLAYTTVASLGLLVMLTGIGSDKAVEAAVLYLVAHSLFKGALFMVAGLIDHEAGTRDIHEAFRAAPRHAGDLRRRPAGGAVHGRHCRCSSASSPRRRSTRRWSRRRAGRWLLLVAAIVGNALMFAIALHGRAEALHRAGAADAETRARRPVAALGRTAGAGRWVAWLRRCSRTRMHALVSSPLASADRRRCRWRCTSPPLPHLGLPLFLSIAHRRAGHCGLCLAAIGCADRRIGALSAIGWGPDRGFDQAMRGLVRLSFAVTAIVQNGRLDIYMTTVFIVLAAGAALPAVLPRRHCPLLPVTPDILPHEWQW